MPHVQIGRLLIAGAIVGILGAGGLISTLIMHTPADMRVEPDHGVRTIGEDFEVSIVVESAEPVNVFKGDMRFDPNMLVVKAIDYNTSIADLWAERPWFSNGEGTLNFVGGTTRQGGFMGEGTLITITFETREVGRAVITMNDVRILKHDGLGTDADIAPSIDAIFEVSNTELQEETVLEKVAIGPKLNVIPDTLNTDLNNDGKQSFADISIFMRYMFTGDERGDFNQDGSVDTTDLGILRNVD